MREEKDIQYLVVKPDTLDQAVSFKYPENIVDLTIVDGQAEWKGEVMDSVFGRFVNVQRLVLHIKNLKAIPSFLKSFTKLRSLSLSNSKVKDFAALNTIEHLKIGGGASQNIAAIVPGLKKCKNLVSLTLSDHYGREFPKELMSLDQLKTLKLGHDYFKKRDLNACIQSIAEMKFLQNLKIDSWNIQKDLDSDILKLDFLNTLEVRVYEPMSNIPSFVGGFQHCKLVTSLKPVDEFYTLIKGEKLSVEEQCLHFAMYCRNHNAVKQLIPDTLANIGKDLKTIYLTDNIKGWTKKRINECLSGRGVSICKEMHVADIVVVSLKSEYEKLKEVMTSGVKLCTEDTFKEYLETSQDKWLLEDSVEDEVEENVYRLLTSNDVDNFRLAFEIVKGGGINKTVLSMIAAVALAHPDKNIAKEAQNIYVKRASDQLFESVKKIRGFSLRRSSNSMRKVNAVANIKEIDFTAFFLMHHLLAGSNPVIQDVKLGVLELKQSELKSVSSLVKYFDVIKHIKLDTRKDFNYQSLKDNLQFLHLESLSIANCHFDIGQEIEHLISVKDLDVSYNNIKAPNSLRELKSLHSLNLNGTGISDFSFLNELKEGIKKLSLDALKLLEIPSEVYELLALNALSIRQNKIPEIREEIISLKSLSKLDLSSNKLNSVPDILWKLPLEILNLRANKIREFKIGFAVEGKENDSSKVEEKSFFKRLFGGGGNEETKRSKTLFELPNLKELNLGKNELTEVHLNEVLCPGLYALNIEGNNLGSIDETVFINSQISTLIASKNKMKDLPEGLKNRSGYRLLRFDHNEIEELPGWLAKISVENFQLQNNKIDKVHTDFETVPIERFARLYWNVKSNPFKPEQNPYGSMYW